MATIRKNRDHKGLYWEVRWRCAAGERKQRARKKDYADRIFARAVQEETHQRDPLGFQLTSDVTLGWVIDEWWKAESPDWAGSTRDTRQCVLGRHVSVEFRQRRIRHIRSGEIETLLRDKSHVLSAASVGRLKLILRRVWRWAVVNGHADVNVVDAAEAPRAVREALKASAMQVDLDAVLTPDEVWKLAEAIDGRYRELVLVLGTVGLRIREAAGLRVSGVDLDRLEVSVTQVQDRATKKNRTGVLKEPKTLASRRTCFIPEWLAEELRPLVKDRDGDEFVFTAPKGGMLDVDNWRDRYWAPAVERLGFRQGKR